MSRFDDAGEGGEGGSSAPHKPRPKSKLEELMERDRVRKGVIVDGSENHAGSPHWVVKGLVVKVLSKALKEAGYYKVKAVVKRVMPPSKGRVVAELEVLTDGALLQVDQAELETVLPQPGLCVDFWPHDLQTHVYYVGTRCRRGPCDRGARQAQGLQRHDARGGHQAF